MLEVVQAEEDVVQRHEQLRGRIRRDFVLDISLELITGFLVATTLWVVDFNMGQRTHFEPGFMDIITIQVCLLGTIVAIGIALSVAGADGTDDAAIRESVWRETYALVGNIAAIACMVIAPFSLFSAPDYLNGIWQCVLSVLLGVLATGMRVAIVDQRAAGIRKASEHTRATRATVRAHFMDKRWPGTVSAGVRDVALWSNSTLHIGRPAHVLAVIVYVLTALVLLRQGTAVAYALGVPVACLAGYIYFAWLIIGRRRAFLAGHLELAGGAVVDKMQRPERILALVYLLILIGDVVVWALSATLHWIFHPALFLVATLPIVVWALVMRYQIDPARAQTSATGRAFWSMIWGDLCRAGGVTDPRALLRG